MFKGSLIEDLIAKVERAEHAAQPEASVADFLVAESLIADSWFASVQENTEYDPKIRGVA